MWHAIENLNQNRNTNRTTGKSGKTGILLVVKCVLFVRFGKIGFVVVFCFFSLFLCSGFSPKPQNGNTNGRLLTSVSLVKVQKLISRSPGATQLIGLTKEAGQPVLDVAADVVSSG